MNRPWRLAISLLPACSTSSDNMAQQMPEAVNQGDKAAEHIPDPSITAQHEITPCSTEANQKSVSGGIPVTLVLVNRSYATRRLLWLDYEGDRRPYAEINPGGQTSQSTYTGHPWVIADGQDTCLEIIMPQRFGEPIILE